MTGFYHRIVVLQVGESSFALVASDLGALSPGFYDEFARQVEAETGISRERLWWTVTHTHSGPDCGTARVCRGSPGPAIRHGVGRRLCP